MRPDPSTPSSAAPDRLFARASGLVVAIGVAVVLATHVVLDRTGERQAASAERAMAATTEAAAAHSVAMSLDRLDGLAPGADGRAARTRLGWDIERLSTLETRRIALTPGLEPGGPVAAAAEAGRALAAGTPGGSTAAEVREQFEARILPQLDLIAARSRALAEAERVRGRFVRFGALLVQLAVAAALVLAILLPAQRRITDWVARSREDARESRFRLMHDPLTGLPNASYLQATLGRLAAASGRTSTQTAVLRLDFDRFRALREAVGPRAADEVLRIAAHRIRKAMRTGDFAAYLGQDDFVVVAADLEDANDAAPIAGRIQAALAKPFSIRGGARRLTASVGVTLVSDDRPEQERILANAEIALVAAQAAGPGHVRYFRDDLRREAERREALFAELLEGLETEALVPFFQPQIDLATGRLAGFEALVRWHHPRQGLLEPAAFLDLAERSDLTERLGELMLSRSLAALRTWDAMGFAVPRVGVNFALAQLVDPRLIEKIKWETERLGIEPARIAIEVLETVLIKSDADMVVRNLRGLASAGFHVELDDFGTGHASIANLRRFMVNRIKIDRTFIFGIEASEEQETLTGSMIAMAHALGIGTLAEGVETPAAIEVLRRLGCDQAQGFHVAQPMPLAETLRWLAAFEATRGGRDRREGGAGADPNTP